VSRVGPDRPSMPVVSSPPQLVAGGGTLSQRNAIATLEARSTLVPASADGEEEGMSQGG
jgi:hypothetical protein